MPEWQHAKVKIYWFIENIAYVNLNFLLNNMGKSYFDVEAKPVSRIQGIFSGVYNSTYGVT